MFGAKNLALGTALMVLALCLVGTALSASLVTGKAYSGIISNITGKISMPVTQEVSMRIESVTGAKAKVYVSWSKTSKDTGNPGSGTFDAIVSEVEGQPKLSFDTGGRKWTFTLQPDGTVDCTMEVPDKMVTRWGNLR